MTNASFEIDAVSNLTESSELIEYLH